MNSRERLEAALGLNKVDRKPWAPLIDNYSVRNYALEDRQENMYTDYLYNILGCDVIERWVKAYKIVRINTEENVEVFGKRDMIATTIKTPLGNVTEILEKYVGGGNLIRKKHFIEKVNDYEIFACAYADQMVIPDYENFIYYDNLIGEKGVIITPIRFTPLAYLYNALIDAQQMIYDLFDHTSVVERFMETIHKKNVEICEVVAKSPAKYAMSIENTSSTMLSEAMVRDYVFPFINEYAEIFHRNGKKLIHHACGQIKNFLHLFAKSKIDGIDSLTPPTVGDTEAWEAFEVVGNRIIIGGLPQDINLDEDELRRNTLTLLEKTEGCNGLIISGGNSPGASVVNYKCVGNTIEEYARRCKNI